MHSIRIRKITAFILILISSLFLARCERKGLYIYSTDSLALIGLEAFFLPSQVSIQAGKIDYPNSGTYDFGTVTVGTSSPAVAFTIRNTAAYDLSLTGTPLVEVSGDDAADFTVTDPAVTVLSPGASTTFTVTFTPGSAGARDGVIVIPYNSGRDSSFRINLTGTGSSTPVPDINVQISGSDFASGSAFMFGTQSAGSASTAITFTVQNVGAGTLTLTGTPAIVIGGTNPSVFTASDPGVSAIAPGGFATFTVTFTPADIGSFSAILTIMSDDPDSENTYAINLSGTGVAAMVPDINVNYGGVDLPSGGLYSFGTVTIGTSNTASFTLQNLGTSALAITGATMSGTNYPDFVLSGPGVSTLAPGESALFTVTFTPSALTGLSATLTIVSDDPDESVYTIDFNGSGTPMAVPEMNLRSGGGTYIASTGSYGFGTVMMGASGTATFTIENPGTGTLNITGYALTPGDFTVSGLGPSTVASGGSLTFTVTFAPTGTGPLAAQLAISSDDADENPYYINFGGNGAPAPDINVRVGAVDYPTGMGTYNFGTVYTGSPKTAVFTIQNTSATGTLILSGATPVMAPSPFTVTNPGSDLFTIPPGASVTFTVKFSPAAEITYTGTLTIASNDPDEGSYSINLAGTGSFAAVPDLNVRIGSRDYPDNGGYDFGQVSTSFPGAITVTIENNGQGGLELTGAMPVTATGPFIASNLSATSIPGGGRATFTLTYAPIAGYSTGTLAITSNDSDFPLYTINLAGTGVPGAVPDIDVTISNISYPTGSSFDFGVIQTGMSSQSVTFAIENKGSSTLNLSPAPWSNNAEFTPGTPGLNIAAGGKQYFTVVFTPTATGPRSATLRFDSDDPDENPYTIQLTGAGSASAVPDISVQVAGTYFMSGGTYDFGEKLIGGASSMMTFIIMNKGSDVMYIGTLFKGGIHTGDYANSSIPGGTPVPAGSSINLDITFTPNGEGLRAANIWIMTNDPDRSVYMINLQGTGVMPLMVVHGFMGRNTSIYNPITNTFTSCTGTSMLGYDSAAGALSFPAPNGSTGKRIVLHGGGANTFSWYNPGTQEFILDGSATPYTIMDGAHSFTLTAGDYPNHVMIVRGGGNSETFLFDIANTWFENPVGIDLSISTAGPGSFSLPVDNGSYVVVCGGSTDRQLFDVTSGPNQFFSLTSLSTSVAPGAHAFTIPPGPGASYAGRMLVVHSGGNTTHLYDPSVAGVLASPNPALTANAAAGALSIPITSGLYAGYALIVHGGGSTTTSLYHPNGTISNVSPTAPVFTAGVGDGSMAFNIKGGSYKGMFMIINGTTSPAGATTIFNPNTLTFIELPTDELANPIAAGSHFFPAR